MIPFEVSTYTDNLFQEGQRSSLDQHFIFSDSHLAIVDLDKENRHLMRLQVISVPGRDAFSLSYDDWKTCDVLMRELEVKPKGRKVVVVNQDVSLAPESMLNIIEGEAYFQLNHRIYESSQVLDSRYHSIKTGALFNVRNELIKLIRFNMPMVEITHGSLVFIRHLMEQDFANSSKLLHVQIYRNYIEIACVDDKIRFYNTFPVGNENDMAYFVLATAKQLELHQEAEVHLYGTEKATQALKEYLKNYVKTVEMGIKSKKMTFPVSFHQIPEQQWLIESSTWLCE
ncbi:MAG: DUF3822 family protein [Bacteroidia bacterium]|nr:DUF3822 family protein [Bacteroidia bacterium]